jgi:hypothetical protein
MKKIKEILNNPHHYKPLSNDLEGFYRVLNEKSFVLIFIIEENNAIVEFIDLSTTTKSTEENSVPNYPFCLPAQNTFRQAASITRAVQAILSLRTY